MLQIKKRKDGKMKVRFMTTICFYQDTRHEKNLYWINNIFGSGYISKRNDGITELRINGFKQVRNIIKKLLPYIKFKKIQANALYKATEILYKNNISKLSKNNLLKLINLILVIQNENYITKKKKNKEELLKILNLTP